MSAPATGGKSGNGARVAIVVLVVLVVAALAGVGYLLFKPDDSSDTASNPPPTTAAAPASTSSAAPVGNTVTHKSGKFSVVLPANGWMSKADAESTIAPGSPVIQFAPDLAVYQKGTGKVVGFAIVDLTGTQNTPEKYVGSAKDSNFDGCAWSKAKVFTYKDFTGTFVERKACPNPASDGTVVGYDAIQLGVSRSDGTTVGMVIRDAPGETTTRTLALTVLESIKQG